MCLLFKSESEKKIETFFFLQCDALHLTISPKAEKISGRYLNFVYYTSANKGQDDDNQIISI